MVLTPIEIIALIFSIVILVKLIIISFNKESWMNIIDVAFAKPNGTSFVLAILAGVVFYYLLLELTIVQIFASAAFIGLLGGVGAMHFSKEIKGLAKKALKKKFSSTILLVILVWGILAIWVIYTILSY